MPDVAGILPDQHQRRTPFTAPDSGLPARLIVLALEGPDPYALAGGLGVRVSGLVEAMAGLGVETHLIFLGDPAAAATEVRADGSLVLHRWGQWISRYHPGGVYDGEWGKVQDYTNSVPAFVASLVREGHRAGAPRHGARRGMADGGGALPVRRPCPLGCHARPAAAGVELQSSPVPRPRGLGAPQGAVRNHHRQPLHARPPAGAWRRREGGAERHPGIDAPSRARSTDSRAHARPRRPPIPRQGGAMGSQQRLAAGRRRGRAVAARRRSRAPSAPGRRGTVRAGGPGPLPGAWVGRARGCRRRSGPLRDGGPSRRTPRPTCSICGSG